MTGRHRRKEWGRGWNIWTGGNSRRGMSMSEGGRGEYVGRREEELRYRYEGCEKQHRSTAGLVMNEKRKHRVNEENGRLKCQRCGKGFNTKGLKVSQIGRSYKEERDRRSVGNVKCGMSQANYARHFKICRNVRSDSWKSDGDP